MCALVWCVHAHVCGMWVYVVCVRARMWYMHVCVHAFVHVHTCVSVVRAHVCVRSRECMLCTCVLCAYVVCMHVWCMCVVYGVCVCVHVHTCICRHICVMIIAQI